MSLYPTAQPEVVSLPMPSVHTEGDRFELICTFTGIPNPEIRWEKGGSVFILGEGRRVINSTGSTMKTSQLEINSLQRSDEGLYNCSVTNIANRAMRNGMDSRTVRLEVRRKQANLLKVSITNFDMSLLLFLLCGRMDSPCTALPPPRKLYLLYDFGSLQFYTI